MGLRVGNPRYTSLEAALPLRQLPFPPNHVASTLIRYGEFTGRLSRAVAHSLTIFRGVGFSSRDWKVEVWLRLLLCEVACMPCAPEWLDRARGHWQEQVNWMAGTGCIDVGLDKFITGDEQLAVIGELVQKAYDRLSEFGEIVPADFLNKLCPHSPGEQFVDTPKEAFLVYGRALTKLLDGKMTCHEFA